MKNGWFFLTNLDIDGECPYIFPTESQLSQVFGQNVLSQFGSLDSSFYRSNRIYVSGSLALQETFGCISKFAGALFVWLSTGSNSNLFRKISGNAHSSNSTSSQFCNQIKHLASSRQNLAGLHFSSGSNNEHPMPVLLAKLLNFTIRRLWKEVKQCYACSFLSLAATLIPPFDNISTKVLADTIALENTNDHINGPSERLHSEVDHRGCASLVMSNITWKGDAVEPKTGIEFPTFLEDNSNMTTEVLVGTGCRSMRIIRSLKVYAFGLYVQPNSVCEKLGPKYASVPVSELQNRIDFLEDLLREDIHMTVRLVVNCNGLKINTVRDAFEKSLRTRLLKMNPDTDYHCVRAFDSYFPQDIPLPMGTTINFRQTAEGRLITEIGGKYIGAVHSKDLCRAFLDMYIGDAPQSVQAKQEIAQNVAGLIGRC